MIAGESEGGRLGLRHDGGPVLEGSLTRSGADEEQSLRDDLCGVVSSARPPCLTGAMRASTVWMAQIEPERRAP